MAAITLDAGVFIALERRQRRALVLWKAWERAGVRLTVPAVVIAEWWRDRQWDAARWLDGVEVEPVDEEPPRISLGSPADTFSEVPWKHLPSRFSTSSRC